MMMAQKVDIVSYLKKRFGETACFKYMPNGGNLGDNLIAAATIQRFEAAKLPWVFARGGRECIAEHDILLYGGGGSLVEAYDGGIACLKFLLSLGKPLVVLPQTVRGHEAFWNGCGRITVFCRDRPSFEYLGAFPHVERLLADDMAVGLDLTHPVFHAVVQFRQRLASTGQLMDILCAFRRDQEAASNRRLAHSIDISELAHPSMRTIEEINALATFFLMAVAPFRKIRTDRLHVTIAGGLLGIETEMEDNSYGKNRNIYEGTLAERFPMITFVSSTSS